MMRYMFERRNLCRMQVVEQVVYQPNFTVVWPRIALIAEDGSVLYEKHDCTERDYFEMDHMCRQIIMMA